MSCVSSVQRGWAFRHPCSKSGRLIVESFGWRFLLSYPTSLFFFPGYACSTHGAPDFPGARGRGIAGVRLLSLLSLLLFFSFDLKPTSRPYLAKCRVDWCHSRRLHGFLWTPSARDGMFGPDQFSRFFVGFFFEQKVTQFPRDLISSLTPF